VLESTFVFLKNTIKTRYFGCLDKNVLVALALFRIYVDALPVQLCMTASLIDRNISIYYVVATNTSIVLSVCIIYLLAVKKAQKLGSSIDIIFVSTFHFDRFYS
jgi:hypothetical protein